LILLLDGGALEPWSSFSSFGGMPVRINFNDARRVDYSPRYVGQQQRQQAFQFIASPFSISSLSSQQVYLFEIDQPLHNK